MYRIIIMIVVAAVLCFSSFFKINYSESDVIAPSYEEQEDSEQEDLSTEEVDPPAEEVEETSEESSEEPAVEVEESSEEEEISAVQVYPDYLWNLDQSLEEYFGVNCSVYGDTEVTSDGASFDGDGDYISCKNGMNIPNEYTFHTVLRCDDVDKEYSNFFAKYEINNAGSYAYSFNEGRINIWICNPDGTHIEVESTNKVKNGEWYSITVTNCYGLVSLYINGVYDTSLYTSEIVQSTDEVTIGRQSYLYGDEKQLQFTGVIKMIAVYDSLLTDSEIYDLYTETMH